MSAAFAPGSCGLTRLTPASLGCISRWAGALTALRLIFIFGLPCTDGGLMDSTTQMKDVTPENVRKFLLTRYSELIKARRKYYHYFILAWTPHRMVCKTTFIPVPCDLETNSFRE